MEFTLRISLRLFTYALRIQFGAFVKRVKECSLFKETPVGMSNMSENHRMSSSVWGSKWCKNGVYEETTVIATIGNRAEPK